MGREVKEKGTGGDRRGRGRNIPVPDWESEKMATLGYTARTALHERSLLYTVDVLINRSVYFYQGNNGTRIL